MSKIVRAVLAAALLALAAPALSDDAPSVAKQRRKELNRIDRETFHESLLARRDLPAKGPPPADGYITELADGSYYQSDDKSIAFEELGPIMIVRTALRNDGRLLLVTLSPPSRLLTPAVVGGDDPDRFGVSLLVDLDVDAAGGVRQALQSLVYLPGESPDSDTVARCLERYPKMDEKRSRLRCGLTEK